MSSSIDGSNPPNRAGSFVTNAAPLVASAAILATTRRSTVINLLRYCRGVRCTLQTNWYLSRCTYNTQTSREFRSKVIQYAPRMGIIGSATAQAAYAYVQDKTKPKTDDLLDMHIKELSALGDPLTAAMQMNQTAYDRVELELERQSIAIYACDPSAQAALFTLHSDIRKRYEERRKTTQAELEKVLAPLVSTTSSNTAVAAKANPGKELIAKTATAFTEVGLCIALGKTRELQSLCNALKGVLPSSIVDRIVINVMALSGSEVVKNVTNYNASMHHVNACSQDLLHRFEITSHATAAVQSHEHPVVQSIVNVLVQAVGRVVPAAIPSHWPSDIGTIAEVGATALLKTEAGLVVPDLTHARVQKQIRHNLLPLKQKHELVIADATAAVDATKKEIGAMQVAIDQHTAKPASAADKPNNAK